jgi:hypothetical protein
MTATDEQANRSADRRDLLRRNSSASVHKQKRRGDITEFPTDEGTRYLPRVPD